MPADDLTGQLQRLLTGLTDQEIRQGKDFIYDGARLHADEVSDLLLASVLCVAQDLSERVGMGRFGYRFELTSGASIGFPLVMELEPHHKCFLEVAPFVTEVIEGQLINCRLDLARLFEGAIKLIKPDFSLDRDSDYSELGG